jgi:UDP-N-acetylmuramoyl-tripeptide--D-alanyl-D-alanine ligase
MGELGAESERAHRELGALVAQLGIEGLFAFGERAAEVAEAAIGSGMEPQRVAVGRDHDELASRIHAALAPGDWVLVKGSRAMRLERIVERLTQEAR